MPEKDTNGLGWIKSLLHPQLLLLLVLLLLQPQPLLLLVLPELPHPVLLPVEPQLLQPQPLLLLNSKISKIKRLHIMTTP